MNTTDQPTATAAEIAMASEWTTEQIERQLAHAEMRYQRIWDDIQADRRNSRSLAQGRRSVEAWERLLWVKTSR